MIPDLLPILAQSVSESSSSFQESLIRILAVLCVLTVLWLGVMYLLYKRTVERRRREHDGLEPLPNLVNSLSQWFQRVTNPNAPPPRPVRSAVPDVAMPDLDLLTGDFVEPDYAAADPVEGSPAPARADLEAAFELPPAVLEPEPAPEYEIEPLAETFALEPLPRENSIPVDQMESEDDMPAPPDSIELLRVWRDLSDGSLIIEIGGQRFTSAAELQGANLDRRFVNVVRDLTNLLKGAPQQPAAASKLDAPKPAPVAPAAPRRAAPSVPAAPSAASDIPDKPTPKLPDLNGEMPSMSPSTMFRQMGRVAMGYKPPPSEETPNLSIPDQIEAVLQRRLMDMPEYADRSIHVRPSPFGGVRIEVDGEFFDGVGDVPDDEVRAMIQDVVREWEEGQ